MGIDWVGLKLKVAGPCQQQMSNVIWMNHIPVGCSCLFLYNGFNSISLPQQTCFFHVGPDFKLIPNYEPITDWGPYYHWAQRADVQKNLNKIKEMVSGNWPWGASANLELKDGELRVWGKITLWMFSAQATIAICISMVAITRDKSMVTFAHFDQDGENIGSSLNRRP